MVRDNDRSTAAKEVRILHISPFSFGAIVSLCFAVYLLCSNMNEVRVNFLEFSPPLTTASFLKEIFLNGGLGFLFGLVLGFLAGAFVAACYNMAARTTGGLIIRIRESEDT